MFFFKKKTRVKRTPLRSALDFLKKKQVRHFIINLKKKQNERIN